MKQMHVAVLTIGGAAHIYPILGLCAKLASRGHRITYVATDDDAEKIQDIGVRRVAFRLPTIQNTAPFPVPQGHDPEYWPFFASLMCPWMLRVAASAVVDVDDYYRGDPPDVVLYDRFTLAGRILAKRHGCPAVQLWPTFAHQGSLIRERGVCTNPDAMVGYSRLLDSFLSIYGLHEKGNLWHVERLNIYFVPREFQFDADLFDDRFIFAGHSLSRPPGGGWQDSSGGRQVILVSESTASSSGRYLDDCIDAFADSDYHVILSTNEYGSRFDARGLRNIEINQSSYNVDILPRVALTICQGGMGTTLDSIYYGVPVLSIPLTPWHTEVAYRMAELGLGVHLPERSASANAIRAHADAILRDAALRTRVKVAGDSYAASDGLDEAVSRIESLTSP